MEWRRAPSRLLPPASRGFTLVEVVVAVALLAGGALALVAASAAAVRTIATAESQSLAVGMARGRVELLAASRCSRLLDGSEVDSARGIRERWTVALVPNGARRLTDSLEYVDRGARRHVVLQRLLLC